MAWAGRTHSTCGRYEKTSEMILGGPHATHTVAAVLACYIADVLML